MSEETHFDKTQLNTVKRYKHRAAYDRKTIFAIAQGAPVLHVSFISDDGLPQCIPMVGALEETSDGEAFLYLHGSSVSRMVKTLDDGGLPMCVTATMVDGFILSLTPYSHDVQYRCAVLHGSTFPFSEEYDGDVDAAKLNALKLITNAVCPDRWEYSRVPPTPAELKATGVIRLRIEQASAKINGGGASDNATDMANEDLKARVWTGVLPIRTVTLPPIASEYNQLTGAKVPEHVAKFQERFAEKYEAGKNAVTEDA
ncbi:hypothetical protein T439DRAFT_172566 [Meredithblackwellia eburnea MCA 4105]